MELWWVICAMVVLFVGHQWRKRRGLPPGPWGLPVVGYLPWLEAAAPHLSLSALSRRFGPIYSLQLGSVHTVVLSDARLVRKALNSPATSGRPPLFLTHGIMQGHGLICAEGKLWKDQRRFASTNLKLFGAGIPGENTEKIYKLIIDNVEDFVQYVKNLGDSVTIDPLEPLRHSVGSVINTIVFGKTWSRNDDIWKWLLELQEEGTKHIGVAGPLNFLPFLRFLPKFKRTMDFLINGKIETHKVYQELINEKQQQFIEHATVSTIPSDFIEAFLIEREKRKNTDSETFYNDQQFYHLLADLFGAGLDTTLTTLRWYLLYLAVHKNVQATVREHLDRFLKGRPPGLEHFPAIPYMEASIAEVQRIRSVVPVGIPHVSGGNFELDGYKIPKGTMIIPLLWALHMNPTDWPEPEMFKPERFINEQGDFFKPDAFLPFQTGRRMCIGDHLGRMMLYLFGSTIVQNFEIDCVPPVDLVGDCGITLTPKPHKLVFRKL